MKVRKRLPGRPPVLTDPVRFEVVMERDMRDALNILAGDMSVSRNDLVRIVVGKFLKQEPR